MTERSSAIPGQDLWPFRVKPALGALALFAGFICVPFASAQGPQPAPQQPWLQYTDADGETIGVSLSVYNTSVEIRGLLAETTITMTFL